MGTTVIVIPHAGGMASAYYDFLKFADAYVDFKIVELPGHGGRFDEDLVNTFEKAVDDIYLQCKDVIENGEYVVFGHSMGSWLAYELYYKIKSEGMPLPMHMFFSGNNSPYKERSLSFSTMSDEEFIQHILKNEQTSEEIFKNPELRALFLPVLRSDYSLLENYKPVPGREPVDCNISILCGMSDPLLMGGVSEWNELTARECEITYFEGNHFYLFNNLEEVFDYVYRNIEMCNNY